MKPVLLLNADRWTPLDMIDFNDAVSNLITGKYVIHAAYKEHHVQGPLRTDGSRFQIPWPISVYVNRYVVQDFKKMARTKNTVLATRMAILHRDQFTCQYCNAPAGTWDHIYPQSRGGQNTWLNCVAACGDCNGFKANRTPEEAGMKLLHEPFVPDHDPYRRATKDVWQMLKDGTAVLKEDE